ncbi:glycoside hydrolase family protein [Yersinia enterocolitica]|uniref:glycoside hydrolase family protein n=1 Tax=Yersinia enterocolitica TaxID=630 RepID=UPI003BF98A9B
MIADYEGCQLNAYQCSANVWTNGIGHTAGVKPGSVISERQVAVNLVADVQRRSIMRAASSTPTNAAPTSGQMASVTPPE